MLGPPFLWLPNRWMKWWQSKITAFFFFIQLGESSNFSETPTKFSWEKPTNKKQWKIKTPLNPCWVFPCPSAWPQSHCASFYESPWPWPCLRWPFRCPRRARRFPPWGLGKNGVGRQKVGNNQKGGGNTFRNPLKKGTYRQCHEQLLFISTKNICTTWGLGMNKNLKVKALNK